MAGQVIMPALGRSRETGRLVRWLKRDGERVTQGDPLLHVETDMAIVEVEAPGTGVLSGVLVREGDEVRAGMVLAYLLAPPPPLAGGGGPQGRRGAGGAADEASTGAAQPLSDIWRAMADGAVRGWRHVPHLFLFRDADASQLVVAASRQPEGVTETDLLLRLVVATLVRHPLMNVGRREVNLALPVALEAGQVAPVVHRAQTLDVAGLARRRSELVGLARAGQLRARDLDGATFTVSDLGVHGVDAFLPTVTEGQAGALAVGRIAERVVPVDGRPRVRPMLTLTLSCDQRAVDGARAARFLGELAAGLEEPAGLL
jgi:pyruvate dehydrogenase E2 component (dihydrolipoamide acetyltransferase)